MAAAAVTACAMVQQEDVAAMKVGVEACAKTATGAHVQVDAAATVHV